jgi:hypothetical protein
MHHPQIKEGWRGPNLKQSQRPSRHLPRGISGVTKNESVSLRFSTFGDTSAGSGTVIICPSVTPPAGCFTNGKINAVKST